ncbi:uncharacterized protein LOC135928608 [Gordionus sp. m RMFG-2023]|uniref:uncharacterized protein LOC135928608 n=1 Tax=Gordionus sp. m RMFG-2023 TaxID=3053472 RepID=UPI0031FDB720
MPNEDSKKIFLKKNEETSTPTQFHIPEFVKEKVDEILRNIFISGVWLPELDKELWSKYTEGNVTFEDTVRLTLIMNCGTIPNDSEDSNLSESSDEEFLSTQNNDLDFNESDESEEDENINNEKGIVRKMIWKNCLTNLPLVIPKWKGENPTVDKSTSLLGHQYKTGQGG